MYFCGDVGGAQSDMSSIPELELMGNFGIAYLKKWNWN